MNQENTQVSDDVKPGWEHINCSCIAGIRWDGNDCNECGAMGFYYRHIKSGVLAQYPGGPFLGGEPRNYKEFL